MGIQLLATFQFAVPLFAAVFHVYGAALKRKHSTNNVSTKNNKEEIIFFITTKEEIERRKTH
jgi:hypothetical protein